MFYKNKISIAAIIFLIVFLSNLASAEIILLCPSYLDDLSVLAPGANVSTIEIDTTPRPRKVETDPSEDEFYVRTRREIILQTRKIKKPIKTVLYPASGSDAITPIRMFRNATTFIGVDQNTFVNSDEKQFIFHETKNRTRYDLYHRVLSHQGQSSKPKKELTFSDFINEQHEESDDESPKASILEIIVTDILGHFPESEIIAVELIKIPASDNGNKTSVSGRIVFQENPNGPIKTYYHIHRPKTTEHTLSPNDPIFDFLTTNILKFGFEALIAKASLSALVDDTGIRFLNHIFKNGGVFIDGDNIINTNIYKNIMIENQSVKTYNEVFYLRTNQGIKNYTFGYEPFVNFISHYK